MKVFNGADFLKTKACDIKLSNGQSFVVKDLSDAAMDQITNIDENAKMPAVRAAVATALGTDVDNLVGCGVVELQGALGFLSASLFEQK